jgi:hypothetical protein
MSKRLAKVLRMLSMAIAAPLLPPPNHQLPRDEAGWRLSSLRSAAARVGFGGFRMSKKLSSPSESLFAEAAAERAEDGSAEDCHIFPVWPFCVNVNTSDANPVPELSTVTLDVLCSQRLHVNASRIAIGPYL